MDPAQYLLQKQQAWFLVFCEHGNENEKLAERSERCKHRDGMQVSRRCSCHSAHLLQWLEQGIRARAPKRTPTKPSAAANLARPPAKVRERVRRQQRAQPGGLGSRLRLYRAEDDEDGDDEEELLARRNARQPGPLPPPTSLGPLPKFASESDVSKEPSQVVSGHACACIGLRTTRMEMMRKSCSRAETHASQAPCLRRPRSAPCQSLRARLTSAKDPAGWSRGTLVLVLAMKMIEVKEREPLARQDARQPSPLPPPTSQAPLPQIASEADVVRELGQVVLGYASLVRDALEARECT